ncbi:LCP family protein [Aerococcaceae bacterium NML171108]|nr:LCP family protein [Aerococcaceae bacterium NML171108]
MRRRKHHKWQWAIGILLTILLIAGIVLGKLYHDIQQTFDAIQTPVEVKTVRQKKVEVEKGEPLNILLLGSDSDSAARKEADGYVSRTDTLMVVSLNPQTRTTKLLSIPRDTYTRIEGIPFPDKINHSYAYGGVELTINTVQEYLDVPIDYYAVINMEGLAQLIDAIGGIEVTSPLTFNYRGTDFIKGETRWVNGVKAMNFARMRYDDPDGEVGRQNRQKMVIKSVVDKLLTLDAVTNYPNLLKVVANNIQTNFEMNKAMTFAQKYLPALENITSIKFDELEDLYVDEVFYFYIPMSSRVKVANELRRQSGLPTITVTELVDPIDTNGIGRFTKTTKIIINQFPTGLTQAQLNQIMEAQEAVQAARSAEYYVPSNSYWYNPPVQVTPPTPSTPPTEGTPPASDNNGASTDNESSAETPPSSAPPNNPPASSEPAPSEPAPPPAPEVPTPPSVEPPAEGVPTPSLPEQTGE